MVETQAIQEQDKNDLEGYLPNASQQPDSFANDDRKTPVDDQLEVKS